MPAVHSTNPLLKVMLPPVNGHLLELRDETGAVATRVYLTGDTMLFDGLDEIGRRHPDIDTAVVHLGVTTLPGGFVVTMTGPTASSVCAASRRAPPCPCTTTTTACSSPVSTTSAPPSTVPGSRWTFAMPTAAPPCPSR